MCFGVSCRSYTIGDARADVRFIKNVPKRWGYHSSGDDVKTTITVIGWLGMKLFRVKTTLRKLKNDSQQPSSFQ